MATNNPHGFTEYRRFGSMVPTTRWYQVKANGKSGSHFKFPGDPVCLVSGNSVSRVPPITSAAPLGVVGVIRACYNGSKRPLTHNLPAQAAFIAASTAGWVEVNVDPMQTYLVNTDATVDSNHIGNYFDVTANTVIGTAAGRSGISIEIATCAISCSANALVSPFQIVAIGDDNLDGLIGGEANQDVEVRIAFHNFNIVR